MANNVNIHWLKVTQEIRKEKVNSKGYPHIQLIARYNGKRALISAKEQVHKQGNFLSGEG